MDRWQRSSISRYAGIASVSRHDAKAATRYLLTIGLLSALCGLCSCDLAAGPVRDLAWYRANMADVSIKLDDCKRDPEGASIDAECVAALEAFSIWQTSQSDLANTDTLFATLKACKAKAASAAKDDGCLAANDAFARWYGAHQKSVDAARR